MKRFHDYQPHQVYLLQPAPQDWLPKGHLVYFLDEVVEHLDLSAIYADYQGSRGQPPYDPTMMVKVWLYAYSRGIRSSRKVEPVPGIGVVLAAGFLAETGDLSAYRNWQQLRNLAGLNVKHNSSGKHKGKTTITKRGRPGLRETLYHAALAVVQHSPELRQLYQC